MKVQKYMYEPVSIVDRRGIARVSKALRIEATQYRKASQNEAALALLECSKILHRISLTGMSFSDAFDFPVSVGDTNG